MVAVGSPRPTQPAPGERRRHLCAHPAIGHGQYLRGEQVERGVQARRQRLPPRDGPLQLSLPTSGNGVPVIEAVGFACGIPPEARPQIIVLQQAHHCLYEGLLRAVLPGMSGDHETLHSIRHALSQRGTVAGHHGQACGLSLRHGSAERFLQGARIGHQAGRPQLVGQRALPQTPRPTDAGLRCTTEIGQRLRIGVLVAEDVQLGLRHCRPNAGKEVK